MTDTRPTLPVIIAEIAEVAGSDAAWALVREKGGQIVYIPAQVKNGHWLAALVGLEAANKIAAHFRAGRIGARILVPMAYAHRSTIRLTKAIEAGGSNNQIAASTGKHERTVRRYRSKIRSDENGPGPLFLKR